MQHIAVTLTGPVIVDATEPVPGLRVYEEPDRVGPASACRWVLAHHQGSVLGSFTGEGAALGVAGRIASLAHWTRTATSVAVEISHGGTGEHLTELIRAAGGQHPDA